MFLIWQFIFPSFSKKKKRTEKGVKYNKAEKADLLILALETDSKTNKTRMENHMTSFI